LLGTEGIVENLTEWRELERQFRQAQKMEAVGRLAGGIAHDFNNLLTVISGHTEILSSLIEQDERPRRSVEQIGKAADRAASLTRQLLAFSRMQLLQPKVLDLNVVVAELGKMLPSLIGEDVGLIFAPEPKLGRVKADPGQIEQVIMNLAVNARDAMPQGGKLVIQTKNFVMDADYARTHPPATPGQYAMLTVSDTGHGMDAETQSRIFEPFFTTKEQGKGTGLGLATVYGIVKQSGGFIWVYSEPGQGTRFEIYLPRVDEPLELSEPLNHGVANLPGSETLMLVEDQEDLRALVGDFLRENGYTVLEAKDGIEGLEVAEQHQGQIHLLVTDLVMPRMGGWELAERLLSLRPQLKVLYLSGYAEYSAAPFSGKYRPGTLVEKPFLMNMLARKVREILEKPN
jgi:nitrogen-specific signal transduction histidine kinase